MSYNNDNQNKIRRRKVNCSNLDSKSLKNIVNNEKKEINNIKQNKNQSNYKSNRKKLKSKKRLLNIIKQTLVIVLIALVVTSLAGSVFIFTTLTDSSKVTKELLEANYISSDVVSKDEIPKYLKDAIVSIEDERFYKHNGVDEISLVRSLVNNILKDTIQGGSTIEMQISKNLLTNNDKTIKRKIKDIYNATSMDKNMSKEDILEVYLNNIYLGKSSYGIAKGARVYFGENVSDLNLAQCTMLAGITNNPARYSQHREAKKRQETILYKMHELGYIDDEEYQDALAEEVPFKSEIE